MRRSNQRRSWSPLSSLPRDLAGDDTLDMPSDAHQNAPVSSMPGSTPSTRPEEAPYQDYGAMSREVQSAPRFEQVARCAGVDASELWSSAASARRGSPSRPPPAELRSIDVARSPMSGGYRAPGIDAEPQHRYRKSCRSGRGPHLGAGNLAEAERPEPRSGTMTSFGHLIWTRQTGAADMPCVTATPRPASSTLPPPLRERRRIHKPCVGWGVPATAQPAAPCRLREATTVVPLLAPIQRGEQPRRWSIRSR